MLAFVLMRLCRYEVRTERIAACHHHAHQVVGYICSCHAGQKVDLTARIREILLNYPEGNSVAKELIQNADDAGARVISFCLDERHHGTTSLLGPGLAPLQGPALLVHNDSVFSEGDFVSISNIGASIKRAQDGKTGRHLLVNISTIACS